MKITPREAVTNTGASPWIPEPDEVAPLTYKDSGTPALPGWIEQYKVHTCVTAEDLEVALNAHAKLGWEYQQVILSPSTGTFIIIFSKEVYAC